MPVVTTKPGLNDVLQVRIACMSSGQLGLNVLHYKVVSVTTLGATLSEIAEAYDTTMAPVFAAWLPTVASYWGVGARILTPPISLEATTTANSQIGANGDDIIPRQVSGIIHERTNFGGSGFRGRMFIPFVAAAAVAANGTLTVGGVTLLNDIASAIDTTFTTVGVTGSTTMQLVLRHTQAHGVPVVGLSTTPVTALAAGTLLATQRRRGQYGKTNSVPF